MKNVPIVIIAVLVAVGAIAGFYYLSEDKTPPNIENVTVSNITPTSFIISWITDEPATTQVMYRSEKETDYVHLQENSTLTLQHTYRLTDLAFHTYYYVVPISRDGSGNSATGGSICVKTPGPPLLFSVVDIEPESINLRPTPYFGWQKSRYADKYILEIATTPQFGDTIVYRKEFDADAREHTVEVALEALKKYYYRMFAVNEWGNVTASNTPNWFTTSIIVSDKISHVAVAPDNTKAVVTYSLKDSVAVISLTDPPHIIANITLPGIARSGVAITYDSRYAVIAAARNSYTLDLNTFAVSKIVYDIPDIIPLSEHVLVAPNSNIAYLCNDLLNPIHIRDYIDYVISVLDVPSAHVVDYIHVYERATLTSNPVTPYAVSPDGAFLYVGCFTGEFKGASGETLTGGFIEKIDLAAKAIAKRTVFTKCNSGPWDMELMPDNKHALVLVDMGASRGYIWWWNMETNKIEATLNYNVSEAGMDSMVITPDGRFLLVRSHDKVSIVSVSNHKVIEEHYCYRPTEGGLAVSSDGKFALVGGDGRLGILFIEQ